MDNKIHIPNNDFWWKYRLYGVTLNKPRFNIVYNCVDISNFSCFYVDTRIYLTRDAFYTLFYRENKPRSISISERLSLDMNALIYSVIDRMNVFYSTYDISAKNLNQRSYQPRARGCTKYLMYESI